MLDQIRALPPVDSAPDHEDGVRESAQRLFERLNPPVRDHQIPVDAPLLAIYDWEIAKDTELGLSAVRSALRQLDGEVIELGVVNNEHRVIALNAH